MHNKKTHTLSLVFALLASAIFGMSFMFSKLALEVAKPTVLLAFRFLIAFTAMSLVILVNALVGKTRGRPLFAFSLKGKPIGSLVLLGLIQPVLYFFCENYGILYTSSAVAGTIIAVVPIACIVTDVLILHERVTRRQVLVSMTRQRLCPAVQRHRLLSVVAVDGDFRAQGRIGVVAGNQQDVQAVPPGQRGAGGIKIIDGNVFLHHAGS